MSSTLVYASLSCIVLYHHTWSYFIIFYICNIRYNQLTLIKYSCWHEKSEVTQMTVATICNKNS